MRHASQKLSFLQTPHLRRGYALSHLKMTQADRSKKIPASAVS